MGELYYFLDLIYTNKYHKHLKINYSSRDNLFKFWENFKRSCNILFLKFSFYLYLLYLHWCFCLHAYPWGYQISWNWSHRQLWVLGIESGSSGRTLNHWAVSLALKSPFLKIIFVCFMLDTPASTVCMWESEHNYRSRFSPFSVWVLEIRLGFLVSVLGRTFSCWPSVKILYAVQFSFLLILVGVGVLCVIPSLECIAVRYSLISLLNRYLLHAKED